MTDERTENGMQPGGDFDDDRLLVFALGLDDDPGLLAAAESDAELAGRLAAMRADVAQIGAQVGAAVPTPDDDYTDLSGDRWSGLKEFFEPAASAAAPRRERRWWRVVAPVMALIVLALAVGIVAVNRGGIGSSSTSSGSTAEVARSASDAGQPVSGQSADSGKTAQDTVAEQFAEQLDRFAVVVLARARAATGALQRFAVLRIFKGEAPKVVQLEVDGQPADQGRLHLLMLDPVAAADNELASPAPSSLFASPPASPPGSPFASPESSGSPVAPSFEPSPAYFGTAVGQPLAVAYTYRGEPTMVREFATGTDPDSVTLLIP